MEKSPVGMGALGMHLPKKTYLAFAERQAKTKPPQASGACGGLCIRCRHLPAVGLWCPGRWGGSRGKLFGIDRISQPPLALAGGGVLALLVNQPPRHKAPGAGLL